jgi:hypothetical protein
MLDKPKMIFGGFQNGCGQSFLKINLGGGIHRVLFELVVDMLIGSSTQIWVKF